MPDMIVAAVFVVLVSGIAQGATYAGVRVETEKWQAAIDAASAAGGGTVKIPLGRNVTGGLFLRDGGRSTPELEKALSKLVFMHGMWKSGDLYRAKVDAVYREMEKARNRSAGAAK